MKTSTCKHCKEVYIETFVVNGVCEACQENIDNEILPCEFRKCSDCGSQFSVHNFKSDKTLCDQHEDEYYHAMEME